MAKAKILVFQHVPYEPLGTLDPLLKASGCRLRYVNFSREPRHRPDVCKYDALIVLGGPMNADQIDTFPHLRTEVQLVREALAGTPAWIHPFTRPTGAWSASCALSRVRRGRPGGT